VPAVLVAQTAAETRLETGLARIEQPGHEQRSALILGAVHHHGDSVMARLVSASITWARDSVAAAQASAALAWRPAPRSSWQLEGGASGAAFALSRIGSEGNVSAWGRVRRAATGHVGLLAGASTGETTRGTASQSVAFEAGAWAVVGSVNVELSASRTRTEDSLLMAASRVFTERPSGWLDLDDVALSATFATGPLELAASNRWRTGIRGTSAAQAAFLGAATWTVTPDLAVVVSGGRQLADPLRGAPDARIMTALVRFSFAAPDRPQPPPPSDLSLARTGERSTLIVRVRAPISARVEVAGSFSNWDPVPLILKDGYWEAQVNVPPGRYRVAYRIDGGNWRAPAGASVARLREFGGEVGLVIVP
jgi:hypothetical protein